MKVAIVGSGYVGLVTGTDFTEMLKDPVVFDGRNVYEIAEMKRKGFACYCIGVNTSK
jgi:UDP-glucose 6-dehydrogenase